MPQYQYVSGLGQVELTAEELAEMETEATNQLTFLNRQKRNQLLADSDWTQMPDSALTDEVKTSWATYRTALRALPEHTNWPNLEDADWPVSP
jgi:hypothetical protein